MNSIFKYLIGLIAGGLIGYFVCNWLHTKDEIDLNAFLETKSVKKAVAESPGEPVSLTDAQNAIRQFYYLGETNKDSLLSLMASSYEIEHGTILKIIQSLGPLGGGVEVSKSNIRIYPSVWTKDGKPKFSLVFVGQTPQGHTVLNDGINDGDEIFEYIGPCPRECPKEFRTVGTTQIQNDIFSKNEWNILLAKIKAEPIR